MMRSSSVMSSSSMVIVTRCMDVARCCHGRRKVGTTLSHLPTSSRPSEASAGTHLSAGMYGELGPGSALRAIRDDSDVCGLQKQTRPDANVRAGRFDRRGRSEERRVGEGCRVGGAEEQGEWKVR